MRGQHKGGQLGGAGSRTDGRQTWTHEQVVLLFKLVNEQLAAGKSRISWKDIAEQGGALGERNKVCIPHSQCAYKIDKVNVDAIMVSLIRCKAGHSLVALRLVLVHVCCLFRA